MAGQPGRAAGCVCCMCRQFPPESRASAYKPHTRGGRRALWHLSICCRSRSRCCSHSWRHPPDNIRSSKCTLTVFIINAETRQGKTATQSGTNEFRMGALNHIICTVFKDRRDIQILQDWGLLVCYANIVMSE